MIYKHSIYDDFVEDTELLIYEFVNRDLKEFKIVPQYFYKDSMEHFRARKDKFTEFISIADKEMSIFELVYASPTVICQTGYSNDHPEVSQATEG